jgi:hypothetical protein
MPTYIVDAIMDELDGRSVFNGIDEDIMDEIREALIKIVDEIVND